MAKYTVTLTNNSTGTFVCNMNKPREYWCWFGSLVAQGTWGSGTLSWYYSIDGGVTLIPLNDLTGVAITQTANGGVNSQFGIGSHIDDEPRIYVKLTGATNPNLLVAVFDNRG